MKILMMAFIANDLQIDQFDIDLSKKKTVSVSINESITAEDIGRIESEYNLRFVSVMPYGKFSRAHWITLIFERFI